MYKVISITLLFLLLSTSFIHAEDASVLLNKYGVSVDNAAAEGEKLGLMEEEYTKVAQKVNTNTMLSAASDLNDQFNKDALKNMDLEIYSLSDALNATETLMNNSKERDVAYIMDLDSKYRSIVAKLGAKRKARNLWGEQSKANNPIVIQNVEQDKRRMNVLNNQLVEQREKYQQALSYPELGEVTHFKSPLEIPVRMTSPFGERLDPITREAMTFHKGMDMHATEGTAVLAAFNGVIEEASSNSEIGNYVVINHGHGIKTMYGHLSSQQVVKNQQVKQYQVIAKSGNTGSQTTGPHLHFAVFIDGVAVDPGVFVPH